MNQTDVINNGNFEISKNKNIFSLNKGTYDNKFKKKEVLSPKNKFGTNIVKNNGNEKKDTLIRNYHSISENINNLKNIISKLNDEYFNSYNSNINSTSHKRKVIKEIPLPKFVKNKKNEKEEKTTKRYPIAIKDIKIRKINNNLIKNSKKNRIRNNNNKNIIKENVKKKYIPYINNYDRDDYESEINFEEFSKDKTALNDILRKNRKNNSLIEKKLNLISIKLDLAKRKHKENKNKQLSPDLNFRLSAKNNNDISKYYNKNTIKTNDTNNSYAYISEKKNRKIRIDNGSGKEIKKNNIENNLFNEINLYELDSKVDDKFDDLYSIIKRMNFSSILLNTEGLFSVENKKYQAYSKQFNNFYDIYYLKNLSTVKKVNKSCKGNKNCSASTKTNNTSYKKSTYHQDNNENPIEEFKLLI
jgi:hypothetical protein